MWRTPSPGNASYQYQESIAGFDIYDGQALDKLVGIVPKMVEEIDNHHYHTRFCVHYAHGGHLRFGNDRNADRLC